VDSSGFGTAVVHTYTCSAVEVVHTYTSSAAVEVAHTYASSAVEAAHTDTCASAVLVVSAQIPLVEGLAFATEALLPCVAAAHIPFVEGLAGDGADAPQARVGLLPLSEAVPAAVQAYSLLLLELPWAQPSPVVAAVERAQASAPPERERALPPEGLLPP